MQEVDNKLRRPATPRDESGEEEIQRAIDLLFEPGQLVEVRAKSRAGTPSSRYFADHHKMAQFIAKANEKTGFEAIWYTLQTLKPGVADSKLKGQMTSELTCSAISGW
jgi:hypothetical protein